MRPMMRMFFSLPLLVGLIACAQGPAGPTGPGGDEGIDASRCTATEQSGRWIVQCPDGSSAELDVSTCELEEVGGGSRRISCPDGSQAVVLPKSDLPSGSIVGKVFLADSLSSAGVLIEVLGTENAARSLVDGSYSLEGIAPGNYELRFSLPPYRSQTIAGITSFGGIFEVETIRLSLARMIPEDADISHVAEIVVADMFSHVEIHDLAADTVHRVVLPPDAYPDIEIHEDRTVTLVANSPGSRWFGTWRAGEGIHWYRNIHTYEYARSGTILVRSEGGEDTFFFAKGGIEFPLELEDVTDSRQLHTSARWLMISAGRTLLVDGEGAEPILVELEPQPFTQVNIDPLGYLGVLTFATHTGIYDFGRRVRIETEIEIDPVGTILIPGGVHYLEDPVPERWFYDAISGNTLEYMSIQRYWSPAHQWFAWIFEGLNIASRDGSIIRKGGVDFPQDFNSDESWAFIYQGGILDVIEMSSGETRPHEGLEDCSWINTQGIICLSSDDDSLVIVNVDGTTETLGEVDSYFISNEWLLFSRNGRVSTLAPGEGRFELGLTTEFSIAEGGERAVWLTPGGSLYAMNLSTGQKVRISQSVADDEFWALRSGVIFSASSILMGSSYHFAPYL